MKHFYRRSILYTIFQFVFVYLVMIILHFVVSNFDNSYSETSLTVILLEIIILIIASVYIGIECTATVEIDGDYFTERKLKRVRVFKLDDIESIRYKKNIFKIFAVVVVYFNDDTIIYLEYWYKNLPSLVRVLCKNVQAKNESVLIGDNVKSEFNC